MSKYQLMERTGSVPTTNRSDVARHEVVNDLGDSARRFLRNKHSQNTQNAYQSDARVFTEWCYLQSPQIIPVHATAANICDFLADQADGELCRWVWTDKANKVGTLEDGRPLAYSTIYRRLNGVKFALRQLGRSFNEAELNIFKEMLQGIASENGTEKKKVKGIGPDELKLIFKDFDLKDQIDLRDRALIMLLYAGAYRRSEVSAILTKNVKFVPGKGVEIKLTRAKRKINGITKSIVEGDDLCPVKFLQDYINASGIESGFLFRRTNRSRKMLAEPLSGHSIYNIIKARCEQAGLKGRYGGHSGRRGFVDTSLRAGKPINKVMEMTGHSNMQTVQEYFDQNERWKDNAGSGLY
ncbi:TPA: site-specific integrase [Vibrio parahaemolyticus]